MTVLPDLQGLWFFINRSSEVYKITFIKNSRHNFRQGRLTSDYLPGTQNHHHPPREIMIVFFFFRLALPFWLATLLLLWDVIKLRALLVSCAVG